MKLDPKHVGDTLMPLIASCRHHNADYAPFEPESMQPVVF